MTVVSGEYIPFREILPSEVPVTDRFFNVLLRLRINWVALNMPDPGNGDRQCNNTCAHTFICPELAAKLVQPP